MDCTLRDLKPGQRGLVTQIQLIGPLKRRLVDMGITPGVEVFVQKKAPLGDPIEIHLRGYALSLRKSDAASIGIHRISKEKSHYVADDYIGREPEQR